MKFKDRVAIVTGAGSGIGAATALLLAAEGAKVALVDQTEAGLTATAAAIAGAGGTSMSLAADVSDPAAALAGVARVAEAWGGVHSVIACAGVSTGGTVATIEDDAWDRVFAVNVRGTRNWIKPALPLMAAAGGGSVVMVASQLAFSSLGNNAAYIASKGAIVSLAKTMAVDHAKDGIRVNAVAPGVIDTPMPRRSLSTRFADPEATARAWAARHPLNRFGKPEEVAQAIFYLAGPDSAFVTGHTLVIDGGWTAH
jgi:NAD(P)-dependent dehydrogenase (short-subunit alcohol dehydrogenase family)